MEQMCQTFILKLFPPAKEPRTFLSGETGQPAIRLKPRSATLFVFMCDLVCVYASSTLPLIFASISRRVLITSTGPFVRGTSECWLDFSIV